MSRLKRQFRKAKPAAVPKPDPEKLNLLLMSNGALATNRAETIAELYGASPENPKTVMFIPFALKDHDAVTDRVKKAYAPLGINIVSAHEFKDPVAELDKVDGIYMGGGNTFRLLDTLQKTGLLEAIRDKVQGGMPYMGASAGINVAGPTIMTTNDMPIVQPKTMDAMKLVHFQINPHYFEGKPHYEEDGKIVPYQGETRDDRIIQFQEENATPVIGLKEGSALRIRGSKIELLGGKTAKLFEQGKTPAVITDGKDFERFLKPAKSAPAAPKGPQP
ncbi:MAG: dipeptidase PepE [Alphaproteobacteria bacterium]|nr:MAG: dipeptidase PepE [Alphaproteobacteria bacterium]